MTDTTVRYSSAVSRGRTAWNATSKSLWTLAELAATVETKYADQTLNKLAADIAGDDLSGNTLANYATTWRAYVTDEGDGRDVKHGNTFSVHEKFNTLDNRVELVNRQHWTAREAAELVKSLKNPAPAGDGDGEGDGEGADATEPVNELDKVVAEIKRLEGRLVTLYAKQAELEAGTESADAGTDADADLAGLAAQLAEVFIHTPRKGVPEHDASDPQTGCPDCIAAGLVPPVQAGSPRRAKRNRRQPAAAAK
jgi:hypothetical protein